MPFFRMFAIRIEFLVWFWLLFDFVSKLQLAILE